MMELGDETARRAARRLGRLIEEMDPDLWALIDGPTPVPDRTPWLNGETGSILTLQKAMEIAEESGAEPGLAAGLIADWLTAPLAEEIARLLDEDCRPSCRPCGPVIDSQSYDEIVTIGAIEGSGQLAELRDSIARAARECDAAKLRSQTIRMMQLHERIEGLHMDTRCIRPADPGLSARLDQAEGARCRAVGDLVLERVTHAEKRDRAAADLVDGDNEELYRAVRNELARMNAEDQKRAIARIGERAARHAGARNLGERAIMETHAKARLRTLSSR